MSLDVKSKAAWLGGLWRSLALLSLNTLAIFLALNAVAYLALRFVSPGPRELGRTVGRHGVDRVAAAYPGWRRDDLLVLLEESERAFQNEYEPFTEFRPKALRGRYFNVSPEGFRQVQGQGPWPPDPATVNVFVFGGSTAFGVGAPDEQTIPSYLGDRLRDACSVPVRVYNVGRPAYYSAQERILFEQLLLAGRVPRLAVFVDGLNEFFIWPRPLAADVLRVALEGTFHRGVPERLFELIDALPLVRGARPLRGWPQTQQAREERPTPQAVITEWQANRRLTESVARAYGVSTLFVWQPVPAYRYDVRFHLFHSDEGFARLSPERMRSGYELLAAQRTELGDNFLWLADVQDGWKENLYVTDMHYRPVLSEAIAERIARSVRERGLLGCPGAGS